MHHITVLVNNQLDAQFFFLILVYYNSLHVSSNRVLIIRRVNCINTTSGICHSIQVTVDHWGDLGVDGWIILGWMSRKWDVGIWTGLGWPRIGTGGGRL